MPYLPLDPTPALWHALQWQVGALVRTQRAQEPLEVEGAPRAAGIYKITWLNADTWGAVLHSRPVAAAAAIEDPVLHFDGLLPPVLLSVGRATNLYARLRQHFGNNPNNNRLLARLASVLPNATRDELRTAALESLEVSWALVPDWVQRHLLECYACGVLRPLLDVEAEH